MERRHFAKASGLEFASAIGELRKHKNEREPELALDMNQHVLRERPADHVEAVPLAGRACPKRFSAHPKWTVQPRFADGSRP
jgi:hypothetical protein